MKVTLRKSTDNDIPLLREMLYEAVFWRKSETTPSFDEGLEYPEVKKLLENWGNKKGDTAVIAVVDSVPVGAAWFRYWTDEDSTRGYYDKNIPVAAIGIKENYRKQGIGALLLEKLSEYAAEKKINKISLCVSKDNYAIKLYRKQKFYVVEDISDSLIMIRETK